MEYQEALSSTHTRYHTSTISLSSYPSIQAPADAYEDLCLMFNYIVKFFDNSVQALMSVR
jgi:hypothetical protein